MTKKPWQKKKNPHESPLQSITLSPLQSYQPLNNSNLSHHKLVIIGAHCALRNYNLSTRNERKTKPLKRRRLSLPKEGRLPVHSVTVMFIATHFEKA